MSGSRRPNDPWPMDRSTGMIIRLPQFADVPRADNGPLLMWSAGGPDGGLGAPASAVTDGVPDTDNDYPFVGLMVAQDEDGNPLWRCSGTLFSPTLFLTAGHCTFGADHVEIWFDADVESGIPDNGYPYEGDVGGTPYTHPEYDDNAFFLRPVTRPDVCEDNNWLHWRGGVEVLRIPGTRDGRNVVDLKTWTARGFQGVRIDVRRGRVSYDVPGLDRPQSEIRVLFTE